MHKPTIGIVGLGRFGQLLHTILSSDFTVYGYDTSFDLTHLSYHRSLPETLSCDVIFLCIPIRSLEPFLKQSAHMIQAHTVFDVCSVKVLPEQWMLTHLPKSTHIISTHPLFGPDSVNTHHKKTIMMHNTRCDLKIFDEWVAYFSSLSWHIERITPQAHDRQSAMTQGLTHLIGRMLHHIPLKDSNISTYGYQQLHSVMEQSCHDSLELFHDMMKFNPYTNHMLTRITTAFDSVKNEVKAHMSKESNHGQ